MRTIIFILISALISPAFAEQNATELLHKFVSNGAVVGYLYGHQIQFNFPAYDAMEIRSSESPSARILYSIKRDGLYMQNGKVDAPIYDDGSRGFYISEKSPEYVTIECCRIRNKDNGVMDSMTIEWIRSKSQFELLKTP